MAGHWFHWMGFQFGAVSGIETLELIKPLQRKGVTRNRVADCECCPNHRIGLK